MGSGSRPSKKTQNPASGSKPPRKLRLQQVDQEPLSRSVRSPGPTTSLSAVRNVTCPTTRIISYQISKKTTYIYISLG